MSRECLNGDGLERDLEEKLRTLRGYQLVFLVSACVKAGSLGAEYPDAVFPDPEEEAGIRILYCGASSGAERGIHPVEDPRVYTRLCSPFPEKLSKDAGQGFFRDGSKNLWTKGFAQVFLKDPAIFENGLKLVFEVPVSVAAKKPEITLVCNDRLLRKEVVSSPGICTWMLCVGTVFRDLAAYIARVRRLQYKALDELERICQKYRIDWYLFCGGLIGALRDGDLIPWDDDLDIAVTRDNYRKLEEAVKKEWTEDGDFLWLRSDGYGEDVFYDFMTRIVYRKETFDGDMFSRLKGYGRADIHHCAALDIYVLDNASDNAFIHRAGAFWLQVLYGFFLGHRPGFTAEGKKGHQLTEQRVTGFLNGVGKRIPIDRLWRAYRKAVLRRAGKKGHYYYMSNGYYRCFFMRFRREWFGHGKTMQVGGRMMRVPAEPEEYLKAMYGNYMEYPPVWVRKPEHRG